MHAQIKYSLIYRYCCSIEKENDYVNDLCTSRFKLAYLQGTCFTVYML